jgi:enoyl-CoA hydratase
MIETSWHDSVALIEINRPERHNALTPEMASTLQSDLDGAVADGARAIVLTGKGTSFCSGADRTILEGDHAEIVRVIDGMIRAVRDAPVPVIAAVNGPALGAGTQLAVACDLRVGAPSALFGLPTAKLGALAEWWTLRRLAVVAGSSVARRMLLAGETLDAEAALGCGLLDHFGDLSDALALAARVAQLAPLSVRYSKRVLNDALEPELPAMGWTDEAVLEGWFSEDFREGKLAAAEKRRPRFHGR